MPLVPKKPARTRLRLSVEPLEDRSVPAAGALDPSFGDGGVVFADVQGYGGYIDALAIDAQKRIVAVGQVSGVGFSRTAVVRYQADGSIDPTFADGGTRLAPLGGPYNYAHSVAIDSAGRILVAGGASDTGRYSDFALARLLPDGSFDPSFGGDGVVFTTVRPLFNEIGAIAVDAFGRIVVAGYTRSGSGSESAIALARYLPDGSLDPAFGANGTVVTSIGERNTGWDLAVDPAGRIVVSAHIHYSDAPTVTRFALLRYTPDGALDPSFGVGGVTLPAVDPALRLAVKVSVDGAGRIVVPGRLESPISWDLAVARFNPDGTLDSAFDGDGIAVATTDSIHETGVTAVIDADGRVVVQGMAYPFDGPAGYALGRFNPDGSLDGSFGEDGVATAFAPGRSVTVYDGALDSAGRVVLAGFSLPADAQTGLQFTLARFLGDSYPHAVTSGGDVLYTENDPPLSVDPLLQVADDGTELLGATVRVANFNPAQDVVGFTLRPGIVGSFDPALGQLTLAGRAPLAVYQAVLRSVTYRNTSDDPDTSPRTFTFTLDDGDPDAARGAGTRTVQVRAVNDPPVLSQIPGSLTAVPGHRLTFGFTAADPDQAGPLTYSLVGAPVGMWLDPDARTVTWTPGPDVASGVYRFEIRAADGGTPTQHARQAVGVVVTRAAAVGNTLAVAGTNGPDTIGVRPAAGGAVAVRVNGRLVGTYSTGLFNRIEVHGFGGNDRIALAPGVRIGAALYGEAGNDTVTGGAGEDVLVGGDGRDVLAGGAARDLLIGGEGVDRLAGGAGDDLLIGSRTLYDVDPTGLADIRTRWSAAETYQDRIASLTTPGPNAHLTAFTVPTDGDRDVFVGGLRDLDWFVVSLPDVAVKEKAETVTVL